MYMVEINAGMNCIDVFDIDIESTQSQNNMIQLGENTVVEITCMDAAKLGSKNKLSSTNELAGKYYSTHRTQMENGRTVFERT